MQNLFYSSKAKYATYCCILIVIIGYNYGIITLYISIYRATADDHCRTWTRTASRNDADGCPSPRGIHMGMMPPGGMPPGGMGFQQQPLPTGGGTFY